MESNISDPQKPLSKAERRRERILQILMSGSTTVIRDLAEELRVSLMTVHRDLYELEREGLVRRVRGAVSAEKSLLFESSYNYRTRNQVDEKRRLARAAVARLEPGNAIMADDSSTVFHICDFLPEVTPLTVVTNAVPVLERLRGVPDIDLISTGGRYHQGYNGYFGAACDEAIGRYHVDVAILSTTTIQGMAIFTPDELVMRAKRAMMKSARRRFLLADASKFGFTALNYVADLTDFDLILLAGDVPADSLARLRDTGAKVELV
ncbi:DeoR/GlpR family DNA-binding transcription regulator [Pseudogemmobacter bohemicus]|uniref:DeoR/GlpR family DNA-binding transcription regulator n=1 Tax=Pseudogemmobacter bohemicus TaxID=2250708 RepID=UPI0018E524D9|nr:DeoR/GlpR family DNA-binding transcription regulator [Pseudogemmobacter bohemicus]